MAFKFNPFTANLDKVSTTDIGSSIPSGTADSILFIDDSGLLAEDNTDLKYTGATKTFETRNTIIKGDFIHNDTDLPDMGAEQTSNKLGYEKEYITDKKILHSYFGINNNTDDGGARYVPASESTSGMGEFQIYDTFSNEWKTVLSGINIVLDPDEPDIEFTNFGNWIISLITGDSDLKGLNGLPLVQKMKTDMGAYPSPVFINMGTF